MNCKRAYLSGIAGLGLIILLAICSANLPAAAPEQPAKAAAPASPGDEQARGIIQKSYAYQKEMKSYSYDMTMSMKMSMQGMNMDSKMDTHIAMEKPNKFASTSKAEGAMAGMTPQMVSDGTKLYVYMPKMNQYTETDAPKDMNQLAGSMSGMMPGGMGDFNADQPIEETMKTVSEAQYIGKEEVAGTPCHHVKFKQLVGEMKIIQDLWVEAGDKPLMRKMVPDMASMAEELKGAGPDAAAQAEVYKNMNMSMEIANWTVDQPIPAETFKFAPPEGAKKVDQFGGGGREEQPANGLIGKPAPQFKLELLDGKTFDLAEHKGKNIVILDFWATWCGPCRKAMPIIEKVAQAHKDKGVILIAVNLQEKPEEIREFLKKSGLKVTVALDKEGTVGEQYQASAIPETVIIGKDGNVKHVHVGASPNFEKEVTLELKGLTADMSEPKASDEPKAPPKTGTKKGKAASKKPGA